MSTNWKLPRVLLGTAAASLAIGFAAEAGATCTVSRVQDDVSIPGTLRYCVAQTNLGAETNIQITAPGFYDLNSPLVFTRSATVTAQASALIEPSDTFAGAMLIQIGGATTATVTMNGLEIAAMGLPGFRGVVVQSGSSFAGNDLLLDGFDTTLDGGALRADHGSTVTLTQSTLSNNKGARGAAIFSQAKNLTIQDSTIEDNASTDSGGGIFVDTAFPAEPKVLTISGSELLRNDSRSGGGGIDVMSGTANVTATISSTDFIDNSAKLGGGLHGAATITDSYFQGNDASAGGALSLEGTASVSRCTFLANSASSGAGISFIASGTSRALTVDSSTFESNKLATGSSLAGGGVFISTGAATHTIANCTFYGNGFAPGSVPGTQASGGAIAAAGGARVNVFHSTIASNLADFGGGIFLSGSSAKLMSSVVSQSIGGNCSFFGGAGMTQATSLSSDGTCPVSFNNQDPLLNPPAANGGPTRKMLPRPGSPLVGRANCYRTTDQRGFARPATACEIGSVEL